MLRLLTLSCKCSPESTCKGSRALKHVSKEPVGANDMTKVAKFTTKWDLLGNAAARHPIGFGKQSSYSNKRPPAEL